MTSKPTRVPAVDIAETAIGANRPIDWLDLKRFLGNWYEIARLPTRFETDCGDSVTATYTRNDDGTLAVRNACRTLDGSFDEANGIARPTEVAGALKVSFAPRWLSWLPFTWADYWVIDLDPAYHWALVGGPSRRYLWMLGRRPQMERSLFRRLRLSAAHKGYPIDRLIVLGEVI